MTAPPRFPLAIAAIFRDENPYLREWLEYHLLAGVSHFFLYDNDGGANAAALLRPYEEAGLVTRHPWLHLDGTRRDGPTPWGGRNKNHAAYAHAARTHRGQVDWLMKIDIDEFLVPRRGDSLREPLSRLHPDAVRGVRVPRINFGDAGHRTRPPGLVVESYLRREPAASDYKELASGRHLDDNRFCNSAHHWSYRWWPRGRRIAPDADTGLVVHHYYTKSLEEYLARQNTCRGRLLTEERFRQRNLHANDMADDKMLRFVPELRRRLTSG